MFRKVLGMGVLFIGVGLWVIVFMTFALWIIPWTLLVFAAGFLSQTREWNEFRFHWVWEWCRTRYFNFRIVCGELPPQDEPVLYAIYPHGHFSISAVFFWALNPLFRDARAAIHSLIFYLPLFGAFAGWIGAIPVVEKDMIQTLNKCSLFMCPGGVAEIGLEGETIVKRRGFLRVARRAGRRVVPIWCPDERSYYQQYLPLGSMLRNFFFFPIPILLWGAWWCPMAPKRKNISRILIGKAIITYDRSLVDIERDFWKEMDRLMSE